MKLVRLTAANVQRLTAIDIRPASALTTVGGKNGAGKTTALNTVAMALGGERLVTDEPIREGELEGRISMDLEDIVVTRTFRRDRLPCTCKIADISIPPAHAKDCDNHRFGPVRSGLTVANAEGARYPSPQSIIDKLLGKLTFDPLAFASMKPKEQRDLLARMVGLDFSDLDDKRAATFNERTLVNREVKGQEALLASMREYPDVKPVDVAALMEELSACELMRKARVEAERKLEDVQHAGDARIAGVRATIESMTAQIESTQDKIATFETQLVALKEKRDLQSKTMTELAEQVRVTENEAMIADAAANANVQAIVVPDDAPIREAVKNAEDANSKVRVNEARSNVAKALKRLTTRVETLTAELAHVESLRAERLTQAEWPVAGLGITEDAVMLNGHPLAQAATSEQMDLSVAIGLRLNPNIKILLVRNGNLLDDDRIERMAAQAEAAGAQILMEYRTADKDDVAVFIEEGTQTK